MPSGARTGGDSPTPSQGESEFHVAQTVQETEDAIIGASPTGPHCKKLILIPKSPDLEREGTYLLQSPTVFVRSAREGLCISYRDMVWNFSEHENLVAQSALPLGDEHSPGC